MNVITTLHGHHQQSYPFQGILGTTQHSLPVGNLLPNVWNYHYVESTPPVINKNMDLFIAIQCVFFLIKKRKNVLC